MFRSVFPFISKFWSWGCRNFHRLSFNTCASVALIEKPVNWVVHCSASKGFMKAFKAVITFEAPQRANQLTGFYIRATLALYGLKTNWHASFHRTAFDYYLADWDGLLNHLRDAPGVVFKLGGYTAASEFYEWFQVRNYVYIRHRKYHKYQFLIVNISSP